jgi:two-component system cell cycle response regulator
MSLRLRLILSLMVSSLLTVVTVGGVSYYQLQHRFASAHALRETDRFVAAVQHYLEAHGEWPAHPDMRGFLEEFFVADESGQASAPGYPRPPSAPFGVFPAPRPPNIRDEPDFKFVLTDAHYRVLLGAGLYEIDSVLPESARGTLRTVQLNGKVAAYVSTEGVLSPDRDDLLYLHIMGEALFYGAAAAALLALGLGLGLGQRMSLDLRRLRAAVVGMHDGDLRQEVVLHGGHEVRELANAFNAMSQKLARSDEVLRASHQTISEQARMLKELSVRDPLTGLYNRRHFDEHMRLLYEQARRHQRPMALAILDLDRFKLINDTYSHATGDEVLKRTTALLQGRLRASDLLARWGGEEFVLALPDTGIGEAVALCDELRTLVAGTGWHDLAPTLDVTLSIGVCEDAGCDSPQAMFAKADACLYRAKENGRNRVAS